MWGLPKVDRLEALGTGTPKDRVDDAHREVAYFKFLEPEPRENRRQARRESARRDIRVRHQIVLVTLVVERRQRRPRRVPWPTLRICRRPSVVFTKSSNAFSNATVLPSK